jgi:predicted acyltransferase
MIQPTESISRGVSQEHATPGIAAPPAVPSRWLALDALRGFSMFWLLGGQQLVRAMTEGAPEGSWFAALRLQFTHVPWDGFRFYDFIFPLFLFCMGVAAPLSIERRLAAGDPKGRLLRQSFTRLWWMVFLGWWVNGNLLSWDPAKMSLSYSVLMMLGLGWMVAVVLVLYTNIRTQIVVTLGILLGYWAVQMGVPVPSRQSGQFVAGGIFSDWLYDRTIGELGPPWSSRYGRGWLITMWTHGATAMLGVFAYRVVAHARTGAVAVRWLLLGGLSLALLGWVWSYSLPIVKSRWTSSYVLWCGGLSWMLLGLFHVLITLRGWRRWAALFVVIGSNSILAYMISTKFTGPFRTTAGILFGGLNTWVAPYWHNLLMVVATYGFIWLLLVYLWRRKLFLRI